MIISTTSGRIRIRSNRLKSVATAKKILSQAEALTGVTEARINPAARSLVVMYDTSVVDTEELEHALEALCLPTKSTQCSTKKKVSRYVNKATKVGMLTTLTTSLVYAYLGKKKLHIRYGQAFVALAGVHMLKHRNTLIR